MLFVLYTHTYGNNNTSMRRVTTGKQKTLNTMISFIWTKKNKSRNKWRNSTLFTVLNYAVNHFTHLKHRAAEKSEEKRLTLKLTFHTILLSFMLVARRTNEYYCKIIRHISIQLISKCFRNVNFIIARKRKVFR